MRIALIVVAIASGIAQARPTIAVAVKIEDSKHFLLRFNRDLGKVTPPTTVEKFLVDKFIENSESLSMFSFVPASQTANATTTLTIKIKTAWPKEDVYLRLQIGTDPEMKPFLLFEKAACRINGECYPASFAQESFYRNVFEALIASPSLNLSSVVLSTSASYDAGHVRTREPLAEFGEVVTQKKPKAIYEIRYGEERRRFAFCNESNVAGWKALGIDIGTNKNPTCYDGPLQPPGPKGQNGIVTLVEKL